MSKRGEPKRFITELGRISYQSSNRRFSTEMLKTIALKMKLEFGNFQDMIDSLNNQGYLIKKGARQWELNVT